MTIRFPSTTVDIVTATNPVSNQPQRMLFVGQMVAGGTATPGQLYQNILNDASWDTLFGRNSMLASMIRSAKLINNVSALDAIPLADGAAVSLLDDQLFTSSAGFTYNASNTEFTGGQLKQIPHSGSFTDDQLFTSSAGFIYNPTYTDFAGSRLEQTDQGGGNYVADIISSPYYTHATVSAFTSFTATDDGTIQYTVNGYYWTGAVWAASNGTLAQSSLATDISAHIATLPASGDYVQIMIFTATGTSQQWVSEVVIEFDGISYTGDTIIAPVFTAPTVLSYTNFTTTDNGSIGYILDGQYWNGAAWVTSDGSYAQSNSRSILQANIATLTPTGTDISLQIVTQTGADQMFVSEVRISYTAAVSSHYATGSVVFPTTSIAGNITLTIGSALNNTYTVAAYVGMTSAQIANAFKALINADTTSPVSALVGFGGALELTAINAGTLGNGISLAWSSNISNYTATITGMSGGSIDPDLSTVFNNIKSTRYQTIVWPFTSSTGITALQAFLDPRWNVTNRILDGIGIMSITGSESSLAAIGNAKNDQNIAIHGNKLVSSASLAGSALTELDYVIASQIGAINALRLTDGADITQYVLGGSNIGGASIASLPFGNTPVPNLPLIAVGDEWSDDETALLNAAGVFMLGNNPTYTQIIFGNTPTTYKTDTAGNPDLSYEFIEYVETASNIREYFWNNIRAIFAQSRLTNGDIVGPQMANAATISAAFDALYATLAGPNYMLVQAGESEMAFFKANKTITLDLATGTATVYMVVPIVTQLRVINVTMKLAFNFNS
jgi:phage tail sheath gpL-like